MLRLIAVASDLARRRFDLMSEYAKARAVQSGLAAVFGLAALMFLLVLVTVALADALGALGALALMTGACLLACGAMLLVLNATKRRHQAIQRLQSDEDRRIIQAALLGAVPAVRRGGMLAAVGGAAVLGLLARSRFGRRG